VQATLQCRGLIRISLDRRTKEHPMNAMVTSTHPARLHLRRFPLPTGGAAVSEARAEVRAAVSAWHVPVDPHVAALLTSELVTNAVQHEADPAVTLAIKCFSGQLRVDVYDTSRAAPVPTDAPADAESGRGLSLVAALADEWGFYGTPDGKAVYFTLGFPSELALNDERHTKSMR
jgi:anti-sigma regulatory factor (Ser/Thr protein kinase)